MLSTFLVQVGSIEVFVLSCVTYVTYAFLSGKPLVNLLSDIEKLEDKRLLKMMAFPAIHQAVINLVGGNPSNVPALLCGEKFNYTSCFDKTEKGFNTSRGSVICAIVAYLFGDYKSALQFIEICRPYENTFQTMFTYPIYVYYSGLISLELAKYAPQRTTLIINAEEFILKLKTFADGAPMNFSNKHQLLKAEMAMLQGDDSSAKEFYGYAIELSDRHNFILDEAVSCERAALYHLKCNSTPSACQLFERSYRCYNKWGGIGKMNQFKKKYSRYFNANCSMNLKPAFDSNLQLESSESDDCVSTLTEASSTTVVTSHREKRPRF